MSCKNANILGKPDTGIHRFRLGGVAVVDLLLTLLVALGLSYIPGSPPFTIWIIFLLLLAMVIHAIFCTKTSVNNWLYEGSVKLWVFIGILVICCIILVALKHMNVK